MSYARELREAFDRSYAEPLPGEPPAQLELLIVRVAGARYAIRQGQVASVHAGIAIAPVPSPCRALFGIANVRGALMPVFDLAAALGRPVDAPPRWLVVVRGSAAGLAFESFERHAHVTRRAGAIDVVELDDGRYPVVDLIAALDKVKEG